MTDPLIDQIDALLALDAKGALVPHGIGGHARTLLTRARDRLSQEPTGRLEIDRNVAIYEINSLAGSALSDEQIRENLRAAAVVSPSPDLIADFEAAVLTYHTEPTAHHEGDLAHQRARIASALAGGGKE